MIEIKQIQRRDYQKAQSFAVEGMHLNWYLDQTWALALYSKYVWYMELNRATRAYSAYVDGEFAGVLLADMKGETKRYRSIWRSILVTSFEILQWIAAGNGVGAYDQANREMLSAFCKNHHPDGEIVFLAADPACKMKGVGSALLSALEAEVHGKQIYLYTDNACTYQFYERRGFEKSEEREILIDLGHKKIPLTCFLYSKTV